MVLSILFSKAWKDYYYAYTTKLISVFILPPLSFSTHTSLQILILIHAIMPPEKRCSVVTKTGGKQFIILCINNEIESLWVSPTVSSSPTQEKITWIQKPTKAYIIAEVSENGDLCYNTTFRERKFNTMKEAYLAIGPIMSVKEYPATFGCLLLEKLYLLVASEVEVGATLPYGGVIWKVTRTEWIPLEIPNMAQPHLNQSDRSRLHEFQEYCHNSGYYFSETANLELPFPFTSPPNTSVPQLHCNWTQKLCERMEQCIPTGVCFPLIRGFIGEKVVLTADGTQLHMLLIGRQNKRNPGPRFYGRGLNKDGAAGNEHFYELVFWRETSARNICFMKHVFLRGTIPVSWKTEGVEANMVFDGSTVHAHTETYFRELLVNMKKNITLECPISSDPRILCISLLRLDKMHQESSLASNFVNGVKQVQPTVQRLFPDGELSLKHLDWLEHTKNYGTEAAVMELWNKTTPFLFQDFPVSAGLISDTGFVERVTPQTRFVRINCADSLDRTNLGCFFVCLQASIVMLSSLKITVDAFGKELRGAIPPLDGEYSPTGRHQPFPPQSSTTADQLLNTWSEVISGKKVSSVIVRALADLFTLNGDCVSRLYTNSAAMHGNILRTISGTRSITSNAVIATQRLYENNFEDRKKNRNLDLLLGRNRTTYFSPVCLPVFTLPVPYRLWRDALLLEGVLLGTTIVDVKTALYNLFLQLKVVLSELPNIRVAVQTDDDFPDKPEHNYPRVAVVQFAARCDAHTILLNQRYINIRSASCRIVAYSYDIQLDGYQDSKGMKAALKDGFRQLVRGLS